MSSQHFPPGYAAAAWAVTGVLAVGTVVLFVLARSESPSLGRRARPHGARLRRGDRRRLLDASSPTSTESQVRWALILVVIEGALRFGLLGGIAHAAAARPVPVLRRVVAVALLRAAGLHRRPRDVPAGVLILGGARRRLARAPPGDRGAAGAGAGQRGGDAPRRARPPRRRRSRRRTAAPARSARRSRSRRRSARSSASCAGSSRSTARRSCSSRTTRRRRSRPPAAARARCSRPAASARSRAPCSSACSTAHTVVRRDLADTEYPEDRLLVALGLRSELVAPLPVGARPIGMLDRLARSRATRSRTRRSSSCRSSAGSWRRRCRTSAPTRRSGGGWRSCAGSRRCGPTSSRSSRTSCAARWPP